MEWLWPASSEPTPSASSQTKKKKKKKKKTPFGVTRKEREGEKGSIEGVQGKMSEKDDGTMSSEDDFETTLATFDTLEEEIEFLRKQNRQLHRQVKRQADTIQKATGLTPHELSLKVQAKLPEFIKRVDKESNPNVLFLPSEIEGEVGVIDKSTIDWWSLVDLEKEGPSPGTSKEADRDKLVSPSGLSGPFVLVSEDSLTDAIAYFVAQCVVNTPECNRLSHDELMAMLDTTFDGLREKGTFHKMKDWATFIYSMYGYAGYAWVLYENPYVAQMVSTCVWSGLAFLIL